MPSSDTITLYRGQAATLTFTMNPVRNVTGWTLTFTMEDVEPATKHISKSPATLTDPTNGVFTFDLVAADTVSLKARTYKYDVWRTDSGAEEPVAIGDFVLLEPVRLAPL